ncbi:MAG: hypothetical protein LC808_19615 [Actinobacteria bacterium]|nr:hypothetical protein [Actinomycetota bacterium]
MPAQPYGGLSYHDLPGLEHVYLEDSYVTGIDEKADRVLFYLEAVLTHGHPSYEPPLEGEQYCYRPAQLEFPGVRRIVWSSRRFDPFTDARGEIDYGNIDALYGTDGKWHVEGDWGSVDIVSAPPRLKIG